MDIHPAASAFPMMSEAELDAMAEDIKRNGLRSPVVTWRGQVVDGRNRLAALAKTLTQPRFVELEGYEDEGDVIRWIVSTNVHRRHMTGPEREKAAAILATLKLGDVATQRSGPSNEGPPMSVRESAERVGASVAQVERAKEVKAKAPDLFDKIGKGMTTSRAHKEMKARTETPTDPDRADDKVVDATAEAHADGYTKRMESVWSAYWKLDETEQTAFHERQKEKGMIK